jgi:hypothetical protein
MRHYWFPNRIRGIFRPGKEIEGLRGGVRRYAAQASPKIDAARAEKDRFRMETSYRHAAPWILLRLDIREDEVKMAAGLTIVKEKAFP